ncbi:acyl-CoA dehydrogenase family protein [Streptomyces sp. NPDC048254]|uniref:acyl-CoA dehydrogenase family protein n=1 Tax=Streptomyces sp. NPDC048254 TaxID=3365525 RepID=UPI00371323B5
MGSIPPPSQLARDLAAWCAHAAELKPLREPEPESLEDLVEFERPAQQALWDAGWTRWGWPEEVGGLGGSAVLRGVVYDTLWSSGVRAPEAMLTLETLGPALHTFAPHLARRYWGPCVRGDEIWCQAFSEPEAGSDMAAIRTRAEPVDGGWVVNGQKLWSSMGPCASRTVVLLRTGEPGHRGMAMFLVDLDAPGVTVRPTMASTGRNHFAEIFFDDVRVPADRIIGEPGQGWKIAMSLLQWERGMYAWQRQGFLYHKLQEAVRRAGPARASAHADAIGAAYADLTALRVRCGRTVRRLAAGETPGPEISIDKLLLSTTEQSVLDAVVDLAGERFVLGDDTDSVTDREQWFFSRAASVYGGAAEIQRTIVAERVLGLPKGA